MIYNMFSFISCTTFIILIDWQIAFILKKKFVSCLVCSIIFQIFSKMVFKNEIIHNFIL